MEDVLKSQPGAALSRAALQEAGAAGGDERPLEESTVAAAPAARGGREEEGACGPAGGAASSAPAAPAAAATPPPGGWSIQKLTRSLRDLVERDPASAFAAGGAGSGVRRGFFGGAAGAVGIGSEEGSGPAPVPRLSPAVFPPPLWSGGIPGADSSERERRMAAAAADFTGGGVWGGIPSWALAPAQAARLQLPQQGQVGDAAAAIFAAPVASTAAATSFAVGAPSAAAALAGGGRSGELLFHPLISGWAPPHETTGAPGPIAWPDLGKGSDPPQAPEGAGDGLGGFPLL